MNERTNGIPLLHAAHNGNHSTYSSKVEAKLDQIDLDYPNISPELAREKLDLLIQNIRNWIAANPGVNINNIVL
jgi:hypothetical protein